jgi:uncharacterized protein
MIALFKRVVLAAAVGFVGTMATPSAWAQSKAELAQKIVQMQQPAVEGMARQLVEMPAAQLLQQAGPVLQQKIAADKRDAMAQEIQADARKYVDDALPVVRDRALKLAPEVLGPLLESKLSEDELRQVLQTLQQMESPAFRKYSGMGQELQRALTEKLVADTRGSVEPKVKAFQDSVGKRLGVSAKPASAPTSGGAAPAKK